MATLFAPEAGFSLFIQNKPIVSTPQDMINISKIKKIALKPSCFQNGCICGHKEEYRDLITDRRKNIRNGITIKPKIKPVNITMKI